MNNKSLKSLLISRKFGSSFDVTFGGVTATVTIFKKPEGPNQVNVRIDAPEAVTITRDNAKVREKA